MNNEEKMRHLEMIEGIIERMGNNCFQLKGWAVALVSAICAFVVGKTNKMYFLIAYIPIVLCLSLDAFYLYIERKYRVLYRETACKDNSEIDFLMDIKRIKPQKTDKCSFVLCVISRSIWPFYLCIGITVFLVMKFL